MHIHKIKKSRIKLCVMAGHQKQRQGQLQQVIWIQRLVNLEVSLNIFYGRPTLKFH